jgi:hypothetical protein
MSMSEEGGRAGEGRQSGRPVVYGGGVAGGLVVVVVWSSQRGRDASMGSQTQMGEG